MIVAARGGPQTGHLVVASGAAVLPAALTSHARISGVAILFICAIRRILATRNVFVDRVRP
jgi:hypothetical protein